MSEPLAHIQKLLLGSALCRNLETVCKTVQRKRASTNVNLKPAPTGHDVHVHTFARKVLLLTGIKDCDIRISGREGDYIKRAHPKEQNIALAHIPRKAIDIFYLDVSFMEEMYRIFFSFDVFHLSKLFR